MRHALATRFASIGIALITGTALLGAQSPATTPIVHRADSRKVIVILRDQMSDMAPGRGQVQARAAESGAEFFVAEGGAEA